MDQKRKNQYKKMLEGRLQIATTESERNEIQKEIDSLNSRNNLSDSLIRSRLQTRVPLADQIALLETFKVTKH